MITVRIGPEVIDASEAEAAVQSERNGAVCTFVGLVRDHSREKAVAFLEYHAFLPLARKDLEKIAGEAADRWEARVAIRHRIGRLEIGDISVVVAVSTPHRAEAFEACRWCIDTLKTTAPIWKRETGPDGSFWIEGDQALRAGDG